MLAEVEAWGDRIAAENVYYYQHITAITVLVIIAAFFVWFVWEVKRAQEDPEEKRTRELYERYLLGDDPDPRE
jgi:heme/copper-type cytochrome/quinol oxidase subunit 2